MSPEGRCAVTSAINGGCCPSHYRGGGYFRGHHYHVCRAYSYVAFVSLAWAAFVVLVAFVAWTAYLYHSPAELAEVEVREHSYRLRLQHQCREEADSRVYLYTSLCSYSIRQELPTTMKSTEQSS